jgi:predicted Zn-dependent protease
MGVRRPGCPLVAVLAVAVMAGCAGPRIEGGVYHSPKGYSVAVPGASWTVTDGQRVDLELQQGGERGGMLVNATCEGGAARRSFDVLTRHLLLGLRERSVLEEGEVTLNGRTATHAVVEGRMAPSAERVRLELYVMKNERCVYDFLYVAPPASFETGRLEFRRFVESFRTE